MRVDNSFRRELAKKEILAMHFRSFLMHLFFLHSDFYRSSLNVPRSPWRYFSSMCRAAFSMSGAPPAMCTHHKAQASSLQRVCSSICIHTTGILSSPSDFACKHINTRHRQCLHRLCSIICHTTRNKHMYTRHTAQAKSTDCAQAYIYTAHGTSWLHRSRYRPCYARYQHMSAMLCKISTHVGHAMQDINTCRPCCGYAKNTNQNGATSGFDMCFAPSTFGAGGHNQNTSQI